MEQKQVNWYGLGITDIGASVLCSVFLNRSYRRQRLRDIPTSKACLLFCLAANWKSLLPWQMLISPSISITLGGVCDLLRDSEKSQMESQFNIVNVNERDDSEDDAYWTQYHHIITSEKQEVWDALIYTFNKY